MHCNAQRGRQWPSHFEDSVSRIASILSPTTTLEALPHDLTLESIQQSPTKIRTLFQPVNPFVQTLKPARCDRYSLSDESIRIAFASVGAVRKSIDLRPIETFRCWGTLAPRQLKPKQAFTLETTTPLGYPFVAVHIYQHGRCNNQVCTSVAQ